jgi:hypothetical protein
MVPEKAYAARRRANRDSNDAATTTFLPISINLDGLANSSCHPRMSLSGIQNSSKLQAGFPLRFSAGMTICEGVNLQYFAQCFLPPLQRGVGGDFAQGATENSLQLRSNPPKSPFKKGDFSHIKFAEDSANLDLFCCDGAWIGGLKMGLPRWVSRDCT